MRLSFILPVVSSLLLPSVLALAIPQESASDQLIPAVALDVTPPALTDHEIVAARINTKSETNGAAGDPPGKYFHESTFHSHYDGRFGHEEVPYAERRDVLIALIRSYLDIMNEIGAETWIMHGSLLGWWWNKRIMPWDTDIDVMVSEQSMTKLANYYNMTIHHYLSDGQSKGRDYLLEINPNYLNTSVEDGLNWIDARWVDMQSGLFIDITTLHVGDQGFMRSKDNHTYATEFVFPLRESTFEEIPCLIPYGYTELLIEEYGNRALINKDFELHHFDQKVMDWIPNPEFGKPAPSATDLWGANKLAYSMTGGEGKTPADELPTT